MTFPANGTPGEHVVASDAQERFEFAVDPDVDVLPGLGTDEMQPFHGGLRAPMGASCISLAWLDGQSSNSLNYAFTVW